jgi:ABC-2 type transport system ATP-binding protein
MSFAIQTFELSKRFPKQSDWRSLISRRDYLPPAVDGVSFTVNQGELFGLVGPNGAGKTTLIKMLSTMILPSGGSAWVNGFDLRQDTEIRRLVGLVTSDERSFFWRLSGLQNLEFFAVLNDVPTKEIPKRTADVLETVGLSDESDKRFSAYSTGMRQRLSIARALLAQPSLLFLDEPTKGLDPAATRRLHDLIRNELTRQQGITVLMTSHHLDEVEQLCDRVAILFRGRIRACGTMEQLREQTDSREEYHLQIQGWSPEIRDSLSKFKGRTTRWRNQSYLLSPPPKSR